jgi:hypothetical protein
MKVAGNVAVAVFAVLSLAGPTLGAERTWAEFPQGDGEKLPPIRAMVTVGEDIVAVGDEGLFCHYHSGALSRKRSPTTARMTHVWARKVDEVYALGLDGSVLIYDGRALKSLGPRLPMVNRKDHPFVEPRPQKFRPNSIWASSSNDVWVTGSPMVVFHFDGKTWAEVDIGAQQVIVPSSTRLTRAVATPRVGPVWGTTAGDVWIRKEVIEPGKITALDRRRDAYEVTHELVRFDGKKWHSSHTKLPLESDENQGGGHSIPQVQVVSPNVIWTRFDNTLHIWNDNSWKPVAKLPESKRYWAEWTGIGIDSALAFSHWDGLRLFKDGVWATVPRGPDDRAGSGKACLTGKGATVIRGPSYQTILIGR